MTEQRKRRQPSYPPGWEPLQVWLPSELKKRLRIQAANEGVSITEIVRTAVDVELGRREITLVNRASIDMGRLADLIENDPAIGNPRVEQVSPELRAEMVAALREATREDEEKPN